MGLRAIIDTLERIPALKLRLTVNLVTVTEFTYSTSEKIRSVTVERNRNCEIVTLLKKHVVKK